VHVLGAALRGAHGIGLLEAMGGSAFGAIACAIIPLLLVQKNAMGRGDLKLFIALGTALGPLVGFEVQLYALLAGSIAAPFFAWRNRRLKKALAGAWAVFRGKARDEENEAEAAAAWMPFAPAILAGVLLAVVTKPS
jgi:prepilin peptidase CpaA